MGPITSHLIRQRRRAVAGVPHIRAHHLTASPVLDRPHLKRTPDASDRSERTAGPAVSPLAGPHAGSSGDCWIGLATSASTYITFMLAAGFDVPYVQDEVGHADPTTTLEIYARASQRSERLGLIAVGDQDPEAVTVGASQLAQHERVEPIRLAARRAEPHTRGRDLVRVQRQPCQPGVQQPLHQHPVRTLDRDPLHPRASPASCTAQRSPPRHVGRSLPTAAHVRVLHPLVGVLRPVRPSTHAVRGPRQDSRGRGKSLTRLPTAGR